MSESVKMSTVQSRDAKLQAFMQMYELRAACNVCTHKKSHVSYSIIATPHRCSHSLLLVRAKVRGHKWSPVSVRPTHPQPSRYEVCWYFKEDVGCYMHHNRCTFASSPEEAAVWNLQKHTNLDHKTLIHLITQRKRLDEHSRQEDGQSSAHEPSSYQEKLLEEYRCSSNEILIISEQVDDVCVTHDENLCLDCLQEDGEIRWKFTITTERSLAHVALLKAENGAVFSLSDSLKNTFPPITYIAGHHLHSSHSYQLSVSFLSFRPGVYEQWLVFDFDMRPVLLRKLKVRVGQQFHVQPDEAEESECAEILSDERWNSGNRVIVPFFARKEKEEQLLSKYKPPQINLQFNPYADHSSPLHRDNYRERAHHFLFKEEIAEEELISRLNVCGRVFLSDQLGDGKFYAAAGKLFATLKVSCSLTPDSPEGLMLKRGVQMALVNCIPAKASVPVDRRNHVYEALVLKQGAGEGHIGLYLCAQCVSELQLRKETWCKMEVQFQLDRLTFCQIHQAIDHLPDLHNVLLDFSNCCVPVNITKQCELNNKQQVALNFILGKCEVNKLAPPLLIYGPFGTGKTLCLASAAVKLALHSKNKVLICTYTNSSADLYVREHFHPYIANGHPNLKILRIKANRGGASIKATDDITQKYCLCSPDRQSFIHPARSDLESHRIIITTTSMTRHLRELRLPEGFFSHILIDEASQMLEGEALMALGLADKCTRVVLAGDHMQMAPKLFSVTDEKRSEHTLLNRLFHYYQDESSNIAKKSRVIFNENYRSTAEIVDFVSTHFYVSDGIKAKGEVPPHPRLHPLMFQHVRGECHLNSTSMSWFNLAEVNSVINMVQELLTDWPMEWGDKEPRQICVLSEGHQLEVIKNHLRQKGAHVSVQNLANIQGKQFRVIIISTVQTRDRLLQSELSCPEFFDDIRALNTALTRAQSLVIVVGDAGALCCFGKCSIIWRSYIKHCISKDSMKPENFTQDILQLEVLEISKFQKTEKVDMSETFVPLQAETDAILKEMDDYGSDVQESDEENEQKRPLFSSSEKENLLELVRKYPAKYKHGELVMKGHQSGYVLPYDNPSEHIHVKGRKNIGMTFPGDEVVVETGRDHEGRLTGKVLGYTNRQPTSSEFVCFLEDENYHKRTQNTAKNLVPKVMIPLNNNTTKIRILTKKETRNLIPVWKYANGNWTITGHFHVDEQIKQYYVFVVQILGWKEHCSFPLGKVIDILPIGASLEEGLEILKSEFKLTPLLQEDTFLEMKADGTDDEKRRDFRGLQTFTVDPPTARDLDDAISVNNLGSCYEIGVHVADVASFVSKDSSLDSFAKQMGATFYDPGKEPAFMFPKHFATTYWSLLPDEDRKAISLIVTVEKQTGLIKKRKFYLSKVKSKKQLTYMEAECIVSQCDGELRFDTLEDCVRVAYRFARSHRKARLKEDWNYAQPDKHRKPGEREANLMVEELNIMFNHEVSKFLTEHTDTKLCTPLRCQAPPMAEQLKMISDRHMEVPLSSHLTFHIDRNRVDLNNMITFTVYSPESIDVYPNNHPFPDGDSSHLRDAISVSDSECHFEIGVHKVDFFSYVSQNNIQNLTAQSNMWSFMPGKNRRAISLILTVDKEKGRLVERKLVLSRIKSSRALSYNETNSIIIQPGENEMKCDSLEGCILVAYRFALDHKQKRLSGHMGSYSPADLRSSEDSKCRLMMEELMLMFQKASDQLINHETPLPNTFSNPVTASPELVGRLKRENEEFGSLSALEERLDSDIGQNSGSFVILTSVWQKIESAALTCDFYRMADLISTDDIHPQLAPAIAQLRAITNKAFFIRSLSCKDALLGHYWLNLESYTHASSPIRRYIDVVLQRLMHAVISDCPVEYSQIDIELMCDKCKTGEMRAREYESKAESLYLAVNLQKQSSYKVAFVTIVRRDSESFKLSFPFDNGTFPDKLPVKYSNLQLEDQPVFDKNQVTLTWKKRMYSMSMTQTPLQNLKFCSEIQQKTWHAIVEAVRDEQWEEAKSLVLKADVRDHSDTSEVHISGFDPDCTFMSEADHYTDFALCLKAGDTVQVQLTSERDRGYWVPTVQLLSLSSTFEICVEHTDNPIKCFSKLANRPSKGYYKDVKEYVETWKPLCDMESAATAVDDSDCVVIDNVHITWITSFDDSRLSGTFSLPVEYVKKWAIEFNLARCLLCIRKRGSRKQNQADQSELDPEIFTWVAHGVTTKCLDPSENSVNKSKIIHFIIKYASINIPKFKRDATFTVEIIPKLIPEIRKESAVNNLTAANELVKNIALRHRIPKESSNPAVYLYVLMREEPPAGLPRLNESQFKALEHALNSKFTVIQGPPGTGKTVVGAYIVYWFSQLNTKNPWKLKDVKDKEKREVILYCGPSNKSVDVVAEFLLKFGHKLKQLRVYSRQMEMQEFPYPGSNLQLSQKSLRQERSKPELKEISLHHRIRMSHNPCSQEIKKFDERIAHNPHSLTDADIEEYKKLLNSARLHELERHDIILCTCTAAASPNLTKTLSARQILIDECAMATEPQTLVPLVSFKPEKVVLLGDHKQLRPIVKNEHVRRLGMTHSLFERYMDRALLLDTQYRMHEEICKFPSEAYYQGRLITKVDERTSVLHIKTETKRQSKHILFGDIQGDEISLVVPTARGNENSKANIEEVKKAVEICHQLVSAGRVRQEDIAILSPYNAQVAQIRDGLRKSKDPQMERVTVTTITKSQGSEWRYVILSMVRSCPSNKIEPEPSREWLSNHIGFVGDENQINVGITRAQDGLCILGNQEVLNCSTAWKKLLKHYSGQGCVVSAGQITVHNVR
ncbi:helicase with zinc finger domain 2-like [Carassius auratus]|uniref:Helicase with zinc finger domain 2-like n=1 Tax=Carassius auratus TaxID=7957 RepID=A0A6P6RKW0_CARAU|nr:helicase with zinc finger domain 2-like [Carassius auratus]XP_026145915.1 helicase with zinc finger domain 2-like [Carassius auratus]